MRIKKAEKLDVVSVTKGVCESVQQLLESYRPEINDWLRKGGYITSDSHSQPVTLGDILVGIRPSRKIRTFPAISIYASSRSIEWTASKLTRETFNINIFCYVQTQDNEQAEKIMYDLTDICSSILMVHQVLPFYYQQDDDSAQPAVYLHGSSVATPSISYGTLDSGNLRAGQIDWTMLVEFHHPNLMFGLTTIGEALDGIREQ